AIDRFCPCWWRRLGGFRPGGGTGTACRVPPARPRPGTPHRSAPQNGPGLVEAQGFPYGACRIWNPFRTFTDPLAEETPSQPFRPAVANVLMLIRWARRKTRRAGRTPMVDAAIIKPSRDPLPSA